MRIVIAALLLSLAASINAAAQTASKDAATDATTIAPSGLLAEPHVMGSAVALAGRWLDEGGSTKDGFYPDFGNMITGAGWISAGPGYHRHLFDGHAFVDASAAISWRAYKMAQARFELTDLAANRLTVGSQVRWQDLTQVDYFGTGADSLNSARSEYRLKDTDVIGYATFQTNRWLAVAGKFGWLQQPTLSSPTGPFRRTSSDTLVTFAGDPGVGQPASFLHGGASVTADTRDYPGHPTTGGLYRAGVAAYSDRDFGQFSFQRYEAEGVQFIPVKGETWIVAVHGWGAFSNVTSGNTVPFYMLPSLGGQDTLRGYHDYRFHDRNLLLASAESRWALFRDVDAAAFFDAGNVAARAGDLNLRKTSWGGGLRVHSRTSTLARLDIGHSREGWEVFFKLDDPFRLHRLSRRTADVPFVP